ncbi:MAG: cysteine hydrolase [Deltaproteobacteria bacterium]|nr:cysteine hydrolase [Deltaproteobacteria bacterium]
MEMLETLAAKVDPRHAAVLVVDVQNDFCAEGGIYDALGIDMSLVRPMVSRLARFLDEARRAGVPILFVRSTFDDWVDSPVWREQRQRRFRGRYIRWCETDTWGAEFYEVAPQAGERVIVKHRLSAFIDTDLELILRSRGVRTLIVTGIATNVCVESTVRDGFMKDYYMVVLSDCTAARSKEAHEAALQNIEVYFGQVVPSAEVLAAWPAGRPPTP